MTCEILRESFSIFGQGHKNLNSRDKIVKYLNQVPKGVCFSRIIPQGMGLLGRTLRNGYDYCTPYKLIRYFYNIGNVKLSFLTILAQCRAIDHTQRVTEKSLTAQSRDSPVNSWRIPNKLNKCHTKCQNGGRLHYHAALLL